MLNANNPMKIVKYLAPILFMALIEPGMAQDAKPAREAKPSPQDCIQAGAAGMVGPLMQEVTDHALNGAGGEVTPFVHSYFTAVNVMAGYAQAQEAANCDQYYTPADLEAAGSKSAATSSSGTQKSEAALVKNAGSVPGSPSANGTQKSEAALTEHGGHGGGGASHDQSEAALTGHNGGGGTSHDGSEAALTGRSH